MTQFDGEKKPTKLPFETHEIFSAVQTKAPINQLITDTFKVTQ